MTLIRSPIVVVLAHVDHGKTTILDSIRGTAIAKKEAGGITQMIGASYVSRDSIDELAKNLGSRMRADLKIPGLLFIDTPGHEAFTNLRERGGSIADIAILVVDIQQGFQPQTIESIRILKQYKTPFVIAANKIDLLSGWKSHNTTSFIESLEKQPEHVRNRLDERLYELAGKLSEYGFDSERFDRVQDFSRQIAMIPISAKTKEGLSELLVLIAGLSQKFLESDLKIEVSGPAKGSIVEVKEEKGLGTTVDVIIYDGILRKGDGILFLGNEGVQTTNVRGLLEPNLSGGERFSYPEEVVAAAGVKIFAPGLENAVPGSPLKVVRDFEKDKKEIEQQFRHVLSENADLGIILKADSLGSIEAILRLLKEEGIHVKQATVGRISRKEVIAASAVGTESKYLGVVMGFNVPVLDDARTESAAGNTPIIWSNVIYQLVDRYHEWVAGEKEREKKEMALKFPWPGKIRALPGFCFRASKPAIFGVDVVAGRVKKGYRLMNAKGEVVGEVREIQHEKKPIEEATKGMQLAISCEGVHYGKNVNENDSLYVFIGDDDFAKWETQMNLLSEEERQLLQETRSKLKRYF